jgi:SOS-response transcriptional repressor LexA
MSRLKIIIADQQISNGCILIEGRSIDPLPNNIIIAVVSEEFLVKRLITGYGVKHLVPDNPTFIAPANKHTNDW